MGAASAAFPVTIPSVLGDAVIPEKPKRVVTIGWGTADTVVALGTTPVGMEAATWGGDDEQYFPWVREAIEKSGEQLPAVFNVYPEIDMEAVLQLAPDLILAPQSGLTQAQYDTLSALAPTVAYPKGAWVTNWSDQITIIGKALGESEQAAGLISGIKADLADAAAQHPEFSDLTFAYIYAAVPGKLDLYKDGDPRVDILTALGLKEDESVAAVDANDGFYASVGLERTDLLDHADMIFTWFNDEANKKQIEAQPLYARIPAVKRGSYLPITDTQLAMATSLITPLSVPWALQRYVPMISDAAVKVAQ